MSPGDFLVGVIIGSFVGYFFPKEIALFLGSASRSLLPPSPPAPELRWVDVTQDATAPGLFLVELSDGRKFCGGSPGVVWRNVANGERDGAVIDLLDAAVWFYRRTGKGDRP